MRLSRLQRFGAILLAASLGVNGAFRFMQTVCIKSDTRYVGDPPVLEPYCVASVWVFGEAQALGVVFAGASLFVLLLLIFLGRR
jgi:hypothetical protein